MSKYKRILRWVMPLAIGGVMGGMCVNVATQIRTLMEMEKPIIIRKPTSIIKHAKSRKNIETTILENAKVNQTIMFGENHKTLSDNIYASSLLPKLKQLGYDDICLEIDSHEQQLVDDYVSGKIEKSEFWNKFPYSNIDVLEAAKKLGYRIHCIDERPRICEEKPQICENSENALPAKFGTDRNNRMYENMKKRIFDKNQNSRVVVFGGASHANESELFHLFTKKNEIMLGQILEERLEGNYSVNLMLSNTYRSSITKVDLDNKGNLDFIYDENYIITLKHGKLNLETGGERR